MTSTFPHIVNFTGAVLEAACHQHSTTPEGYRLGTLRRVQCEIENLLDPATIELHPDYREAWEDVLQQVKIAIADS